jgi:hypothetical protein
MPALGLFDCQPERTSAEHSDFLPVILAVGQSASNPHRSVALLSSLDRLAPAVK